MAESAALLSDYDVLTGFLGYSAEEAARLVEQVKEARLPVLKKKAGRKKPHERPKDKENGDS